MDEPWTLKASIGKDAGGICRRGGRRGTAAQKDGSKNRDGGAGEKGFPHQAEFSGEADLTV
jgi:hypothetical protein